MRRFLLRLFTFFRHDRAEEELAREVASHLALLEDQYRRRGFSPEDARLAARRAMGGVDHAKELHRDARSFLWLEDVRLDLRHTLLSLRRTPAFTAVAVVALGLGIGVNNTFFTLVNAICLRGLPIEAPERVMFLATRDGQNRPAGLSFPEFESLRAATKHFSGIAAFAGIPMTIADEGRAADRVFGAYISARGFDLLGDTPLLGRGFLAEDDEPGAPAVALLGGGLWNARYAGDSAIVGRTVTVNGTPAIVIGVMPDGFRFPGNADLWQPLAMMPGLAAQRREARTLSVYGRLTEATTQAQARAEVETIARTWSTDFPASNRDIRMTAIPINEQFSGRITDRAWLAFITAGAFVVLIACANVANLLLMRAATRSREMAIRTSIGATRGRMVRQLLIESSCLAVLGAALGVTFSLAGLGLVSGLVPPETLPYWMEFTMDGRVLAVLTAVCLGSVFVFGLAPALHLSKVDVNRALSDGGRTGTESIPARRWMAGFLIAEFALTLVLLAAVVMGARLNRAAERAEFPIDPAPLLTMWVTLPSQPYDTPDARTAFYDQLLERFGAVPAVSSTTIASAMPRGGGRAEPLAIAGRPPMAGDAPPTVHVVMVGDRYFDTLGIPVLRGRPFTSSAARDIAVVNQRFADMFFANEDPVGQLIRLGSPATDSGAPWVRIVGVSPTVRQRAAGIDPDPVVYLPYRAAPPATAAIVVRANGDPTALTSLLRDQVRRLDPNLPLYRVMTLERAMLDAMWNGRMSSVLIDSIASISLILALVGLYTVTAHAVERWKPELGIRVALGAPPLEVCWLVLRRSMFQLGIGLVVGIACTYAFGRLFDDPTQGIRMTDPIALVPLLASVVTVAIAAGLLPVRRAVYLDPVGALRCEK